MIPIDDMTIEQLMQFKLSCLTEAKLRLVQLGPDYRIFVQLYETMAQMADIIIKLKTAEFSKEEYDRGLR